MSSGDYDMIRKIVQAMEKDLEKSLFTNSATTSASEEKPLSYDDISKIIKDLGERFPVKDRPLGIVITKVAPEVRLIEKRTEDGIWFLVRREYWYKEVTTCLHKINEVHLSNITVYSGFYNIPIYEDEEIAYDILACGRIRTKDERFSYRLLQIQKLTGFGIPPTYFAGES